MHHDMLYIVYSICILTAEQQNAFSCGLPHHVIYFPPVVPEEDSACSRANGITIGRMCYYVSRTIATVQDSRTVCQESSRFSPKPAILDANTQMQLVEWLERSNSPNVMLDLMEQSPADFWYWETGEK